MLFKQFFFSFAATLTCSAFLAAPVKGIIPTGILGMIGWISFYVLQNYFNISIIFASFIASLMISIFGEILAKLLKKPATLFIIPALMPLVPGSGVYNTMLAFVNKKSALAINKGIETLLIAGAIALGIIVSSVFSNSIRRKIY